MFCLVGVDSDEDDILVEDGLPILLASEELPQALPGLFLEVRVD